MLDSLQAYGNMAIIACDLSVKVTTNMREETSESICEGYLHEIVVHDKQKC